MSRPTDQLFLDTFSDDDGTSSEISNSNFSDINSLCSRQHLFVRPATLRVFISLSLARFIVNWYSANDLYSVILNNLIRSICVENDFDIPSSDFSWIVFTDDSLSSLPFENVIRSYGCDPNDVDFSLKVFLENDVINLDTSSGDEYDSAYSDDPGYREWASDPFLNLDPIEAEILDLLKGHSSDDSANSMVT